MLVQISVILCFSGFFTAAVAAARLDKDVINYDTLKMNDDDDFLKIYGIQEAVELARLNENVFGKYTLVGLHLWNQDEARQMCQAIGKQLVNIQTQEKWIEIRDIIDILGYVRNGEMAELFWTAGKQLKEQEFFWSDWTKLPNDARYWGPGQPNSVSMSQQCILIEVFSGGKLGLNDWHCHGKHGYICEDIGKSPEKPNPTPVGPFPTNPIGQSTKNPDVEGPWISFPTGGPGGGTPFPFPTGKPVGTFPPNPYGQSSENPDVEGPWISFPTGGPGGGTPFPFPTGKPVGTFPPNPFGQSTENPDVEGPWISFPTGGPGGGIPFPFPTGKPGMPTLPGGPNGNCNPCCGIGSIVADGKRPIYIFIKSLIVVSQNRSHN